MERAYTRDNTTLILTLTDPVGQPMITIRKQEQVNEPIINSIHSAVCPDCGHVVAGGVSDDIDLEALPRTTCCQESHVPVLTTETEEEENIVTKVTELKMRMANLSQIIFMAQEIVEWQTNQLIEIADDAVDRDTFDRVMDYIDRARSYISDADSCLSDAEHEV